MFFHSQCLLGKKEAYRQLPYEPGFVESNVPTKARPIQMNQELKRNKRSFRQELIRKRKSPIEEYFRKSASAQYIYIYAFLLA